VLSVLTWLWAVLLVLLAVLLLLGCLPASLQRLLALPPVLTVLACFAAYLQELLAVMLQLLMVAGSALFWSSSCPQAPLALLLYWVQVAAVGC
jgi:hypothetical protein